MKDHLYATVTSEALEEIQKQIKEAIAEGFPNGKVPKIKIELKKHLSHNRENRPTPTMRTKTVEKR